MSSEKSTIDRLTARRTAAVPGDLNAVPTTTVTTAVTTAELRNTFQADLRAAATATPSASASAATGRKSAALASGLPGSPLLVRLFALLERRSPALGGLLAERLWFRLPATPAAAVRAARTPAGGEPFEVQWTHGTVRGRVYGDWGNPTAYLVHGWGGWWQQLGAHVEPLLAQGLCVVAFDAPSHGSSGPGRHGRRSTTFVEMAEALAAVVREFGRPTLVVAHSAGGLAAVHALGLNVRPESLVLVAPPDGVESMLPVFAQAMGVGARSRAVMVRRAENRVGIPVKELDLLTMAARQPALPRLLVVHDRGDREAALAGAVRISDAWHGARLMVTEGRGHRQVLWSPAVVERVAAFGSAAADRVRRSSR